MLCCFESEAQVVRKKDIPYVNPITQGFDSKRNILDIYYRSDSIKNKPVFIFIHGGSWGSGNKNTYRLMGKNLANRGYVAIIVNYRLAPNANYEAIAFDCTRAIAWVSKNIASYAGDTNAITLAGHSAGAHLSAFLSLKNTFTALQMENPIKRLILIDPFGLDMVSYFDQYDNRYSRSLYKVFTANPKRWKEASPLYDITADFPIPVRILTGAKTYRIIREQSKVFYDSLQQNNITSDLIELPGKKHIGMITQFFRSRSKAFPLLLEQTPTTIVQSTEVK